MRLDYDKARAAVKQYREASANPTNGTSEDVPWDSSGSRRVKMREIAKSAAAVLGELEDWNPDDLVIDKGDGVGVYQDMLRDPYVKGALCLKKFAVIRLPAKIIPATEKARDQEIAQFVEYCFEEMETALVDMLLSIMGSLDCGYSISELNWQVLGQGMFAGKIGLKTVKGKDPYIYSFKTDKYDNIKKVFQRQGSYGSTESAYLAPKKFAIMSYMPQYSDPYGRSDLRAAFRAFIIKDWAWKFRAIYMEKFGTPPIIGKVPPGTSTTKVNAYLAILESMQNDTSIVLPEDLKHEILNLATAGPTEYERAITDLNKEILIGIIGSFLAVEESRRTGARAQGQVHFDVVNLFVDYLARVVAEVVNRQIVRRLVDMNYDIECRYPKFTFDTTDLSRLLKEIEIDERLHEMGVQVAKDYYHLKYNRPIPPEDESQPIGPDAPDVVDPTQQDPGVADPTQQDPNAVDGGFDLARDAALPEDGDDIGRLRQMYETVAFVEHPRFGVSGKNLDADRIAFKLAGAERRHYRKHKKWMKPKAAWRKFIEAVKESA